MASASCSARSCPWSSATSSPRCSQSTHWAGPSSTRPSSTRPASCPLRYSALAGSLVGGAFLTVASLVASLYVDRDYRGSSITLRVALARALQRAVVAIAASLLAFLAIVALILVTALLGAAVGGLLDAGNGGPGAFLVLIIAVAGALAVVTVGIRLCIASVIVALEPVGPVQALRRSWHLTGNNAWRTFGLQFMVLIVVSLVSTILAVVGAAFSGGLDTTAPSGFGTQSVISLVFGVVTAPIVPVMLTVLYFDLRVRRDRFELSLEPQP